MSAQSSLEKMPQLCADARAAKYLVKVMHAAAKRALDDQRYKDAAIYFEAAAGYARKCGGL